MPLRKLLIGFAFLLSAGQAAALAQTYPTRPITIVVALAAGTGMDIVVRSYAEQLAQRLGQPVVVENRPGGAGLVAINTAMKAPADGYTLFAATSSALAIRPTMFRKPPYDPLKDFVPISYYLKSPFILVVNPDLPVKSVRDLIEYVKERPGKITFGSTSVGGAPHLAGEYLNLNHGTKMIHVPYKVSPEVSRDVAAGHLHLSFAEAGVSIPLIRSGKLHALAVTSSDRFDLLPEVPTFAESAGVPGFEAVSWHMLLARSDVPKAIVDRLHKEMTEIMALPEINKRMSGLGLIPTAPPSIEETRQYIRSENEKWGGLVTSLGLAGSL